MNTWAFGNPGDHLLIWGVNVLTQLTLVTAVALTISACLRRQPAARYWVLCSGLLLMLLVPLVAVAMQWSGTGLLSLALMNHTPLRQQYSHKPVETAAQAAANVRN